MDRQFILNKIRYWEGQLHLALLEYLIIGKIKLLYRDFINHIIILVVPRMRNPNSSEKV